jgi:chemotaxis methyl-accepting protein methylase
MDRPDRSFLSHFSWSRIANWLSAHDAVLHRLIRERIPQSLVRSSLGLRLGRLIQRTVKSHAHREQSTTTYFLRNRPELDLVCSIFRGKPNLAPIDIAVLGCSNGAEVYSIAWALRNVRPDLDVHLHAVDINKEAVEFAKRGVYSLPSTDVETGADHPSENASAQVATKTHRVGASSLFERMIGSEFDEMFELSCTDAFVHRNLREGITWHVSDANASDLSEVIGLQDVVFANRFLCHMPPAEAERCLINAMALVKPGGYLFVSGIDLEVRAQTAIKMGWRPVTTLIREIHEGDPSVLVGWPFQYWGLEPFDNRLPNWEYRYAAVFQNSVTAASRVHDLRKQDVSDFMPDYPLLPALNSQEALIASVNPRIKNDAVSPG